MQPQPKTIILTGTQLQDLYHVFIDSACYLDLKVQSGDITQDNANRIKACHAELSKAIWS